MRLPKLFRVTYHTYFYASPDQKTENPEARRTLRVMGAQVIHEEDITDGVEICQIHNRDSLKDERELDWLIANRTSEDQPETLRGYFNTKADLQRRKESVLRVLAKLEDAEEHDRKMVVDALELYFNKENIFCDIP